MLWPSDIAPKAVVMKSRAKKPVQFTVNSIKLLDNGLAIIYLFGIKNDYQREGFRVFLTPLENIKVCPVEALQCYLREQKQPTLHMTGRCLHHLTMLFRTYQLRRLQVY